jgi:ribosomal protein L16 Arg81 hydroxylase
MFNEDFKSAVRNREHYFFNSLDSDILADLKLIDWDKIIYLLDTHPEDKFNENYEKRNFNLTEMERRDSNPALSKKIITKLKRTFPKNGITSHIFGGFTKKSKSFNIHRDVMDVLYLQVLGTVRFSLWKPNLNIDAEFIYPKDATRYYIKTYKPGSMIWIPRGTYHLIEPLESRIAFSFGVEGGNEPSTYI